MFTVQRSLGSAVSKSIRLQRDETIYSLRLSQRFWSKSDAKFGAGRWNRSFASGTYVRIGYAAVGSSVAALLVAETLRKNHAVFSAKLKKRDDILEQAGRVHSGLPEYKMEQVRQHDSMEHRFWVTYKDGVYDITDFIRKGNHPGGDKIFMAAGGSVEPFWQLYAVHKDNPEILAMLEEYRIGNLAVEDRLENAKQLSEMEANNPYAGDPKRHPLLRPASTTPFNAESPPSILAENFLTPNEFFYVRNHLPVPDVAADEYELEIEVEGRKDVKTLSLNDLKTKFPKHTVMATIQCAGNRRSEMNEVKKVKGLSWGRAAIGNASWSGASLKDVLKLVGVEEGTCGSWKHLHLDGLDQGPDGSQYAVSIPLSKALAASGDCILAYEMNGEPIPRDHGFPVRAVVPGTVGARNVKWLGHMKVAQEESRGHWQANDYKGFSPSVDWDTVDFDKAPAIQELPVQSAICEPEDGQKVEMDCEGKVSLKGYAWSGGGRGIVRVDVSVDGGKTWQVADLIQNECQEYNKSWAWTLWKLKADVGKGIKCGDCLKVCVKAVDSSYNTQPEEFGPIWNLRGVISNAWHKIVVFVK